MAQATPGEHADEIVWSERQREVLDLLVARKTNGEIAAQLGITLDGAKYHVREILDRLDVDTREEAAEWWRQQRGLRARMRVVGRRWRLPVLVKVGAGAAGVAVVGVAMGLMLLTGGGEPDVPGEGELWFALSRPVESDGVPWALSQLEVFDAERSEVTALGEPTQWADAAWAPDGSGRLYALEIGEGPDDMHVHFFEPFTGDHDAYAIEQELLPGRGYWSPQGDRVAFAGADAGIWTMDLNGATTGPLAIEAQGGGGSGPGVSWSPDGERLALNRGGTLGIVGADLAVVEWTDADEWLPDGLDAAEGAAGVSWFWWREPDTLEVVVAGSPAPAFVDVSVSDDGAARGTEFEEAPSAWFPWTAYEAFVAELPYVAPDVQAGCRQCGAPGEDMTVALIAHGEAAGEEAVIAVEWEGELVEISVDLPEGWLGGNPTSMRQMVVHAMVRE